MKKTLLTALCLGAAMFASAQVTVFEDDFEWLEPWSSQKPAGQTVETDNPDATAQQLGTNKVDEVSTYDALLAKGYEFIAVHADGKDERKPQAQAYLQRNYLKFGLTGYQTGLVLPALTAGFDNVTLTFDWCSQRQGSGKWDPTKLVVMIGDKVVEVPEYVREDNSAYSWVNTSVALGNLKAGDKITIRNCDEQWPTASAMRWFIDNIKVTANSTGAVENLEVENNAAPEYFNLQGVRVANPENGLYIVRRGTTVSKVMVK